MSRYNIISFVGIFCLMLMAWVLSSDRRNVNWRVIFWGVALQLLFAFFIFRIKQGMALFYWINNVVVKILSFAHAGLYFVFGPLALSPGAVSAAGEKSLGFILAFQALPLAIFFSSLMALLYHLGIMQKIIKGFSWIFTRLMRISGAESLCTSSNIAVGIESVFTIRPYIAEMTRSELCMLLTSGMATIASTVLGVYVGVLKKEFPTIAGHLVSASMLSAPAAIVMSKLIYPEDGKPLTLGYVVAAHYEKSSNWIEAIIRGSHDGVRLVVGIVALLISFLGLLAMCNWVMGVFGNTLGKIVGFPLEISLQKLLTYVYYPFSAFMGVPPYDIPKVSALLGERTIVTELVSYQHLVALIRSGELANPRSIVIATYALCGFSHIASLAIFVGGGAVLAPRRAKDLAQLGFRALYAATLACLMTGAVAGVFIVSNQPSILMQ